MVVRIMRASNYVDVRDGIFLEKLETDPSKYLPEVRRIKISLLTDQNQGV